MKARTHTLGFDDRWLLLTGIPLLGFLIPVIFFKADLAEGLSAYLPEWGMSTLYTTSYWFSMRYLFIAMRRKFPGYHQVGRRLIFTILFLLVIFFTLNAILGQLHIVLGDHGRRPGVTDFDYTVASLMIVLLVSVIYESVFLYHRWKESLIEAERLRRENVESQLEGLKNQVNPHFLFNSLNTLSYLIPEDPERAVRFVQQLSYVYRYVLDMRNRKLISLEEESDFISAYIFLLKERFGDNLEVHIDLPPRLLNRQVVPLAMQMLLENAIKHNIISHEKPLRVEVTATEEALVVRNNLQRKKQQMPSTQVGLPNIKSRYAFFTDKEVKIEETADLFAVHLPLLSLEPEPAV